MVGRKASIQTNSKKCFFLKLKTIFLNFCEKNIPVKIVVAFGSSRMMHDNTISRHWYQIYLPYGAPKSKLASSHHQPFRFTFSVLVSFRILNDFVLNLFILFLDLKKLLWCRFTGNLKGTYRT